MEKTLYRTKRGSFKIQWIKNIFLIGTANERDEFIIVLFQFAFVFQKPDRKSKIREV